MTGNPLETQYTYDSRDEPVSIAVVEAVADAIDSDALSMRPIHRTVETDALDALLDDDSGETTVTFSYAGCHVEADGERVVVRVPDD